MKSPKTGVVKVPPTKTKTLEPLKTFNFFMKFFRICAVPIVGAFLEPNWKWNWKTTHVALLLVGSSMIYILNAYEARRDTSTMFVSIVLGLFDAMGIQRFMKFVENRELFMGSLEEIRVFTEKWEQRSEGYDILVWYYRLLKNVIVFGILLYFSIGITLATAPIIIFLATDRLQLVYQLYLPYIDHTVRPGFEIHVLTHTYMITMFMISLAALVGIVLIFIVMVCAKVDVLRARLKILGDLVVKEKNPDKNTKAITELLHEIYADHQHILEYVDNCEQQFSLQNLADHFIFGAQICLSIFALLNHSWFMGIAIVLMDTFILFTLDLLGTIISVKFELLLNDIWDVSWYLMDLENKKDFYYFLGNTQKTDRLTLGGRVPLSLDTFVRFYKGIYSYVMILFRTQT